NASRVEWLSLRRRAVLVSLFWLSGCGGEVGMTSDAGVDGGRGGSGVGGNAGAGTGGATGSAGATASGGAPGAGGLNGGGGAAGGSATGGRGMGGSGSGGSGAGGMGQGGAGTGGSGTGGSGAASCPGASATELNLISSWLTNTAAVGALPNYAYNNIKTNFPAGAAFNTLVCSIAMSCVEFAPMESDWLRKCEAVVSSAIVAESSYVPGEVVNDSYSTRTVNGVTASDPTVGLLQ